MNRAVAGDIVDGRQLHVNGVGQRDRNRDDPDECDEEEANAQFHARLERMHDDKVAVDGDGQRGQRGYVHGDRH